MQCLWSFSKHKALKNSQNKSNSKENHAKYVMKMDTKMILI